MLAGSIVSLKMIVKRQPANISRWSDFSPKTYCISFFEFVKLTTITKCLLSIKCLQWFKFFSLFETQIHYIDIKIPNTKGQKSNLFWGVFQFITLFFFTDLTAKNQPDKQMPGTIPSMQLHYKSRSFSRLNDWTLVSLI